MINIYSYSAIRKSVSVQKVHYIFCFIGGFIGGSGLKERSIWFQQLKTTILNMIMTLHFSNLTVLHRLHFPRVSKVSFSSTSQSMAKSNMNEAEILKRAKEKGEKRKE